MAPLVILGAGYTGRRIYRIAHVEGRAVIATSRNPERLPADVAPSSRRRFDLERPETWGSVPAGANVIWCFPAAPPDRVAAYADRVLPGCRRLVVLGSTSAYLLDGDAPDQAVDESTPLDPTRPRVAGEEYLRRRHGATVLRVAGIYGPGRHVLNWIRRGRIAASPRVVNLIHVEDLAAICLTALEKGRPGETYNVSDGRPRRWIEVCREAARRWGVPVPATREDPRPGKRLSIDKLRREFGYVFMHPDLFHALGEIEAAEQERLSAGERLRGG
ncbi:NAD-dependent epimerase/dehydratase family protein [Candidatus Nitrospira bockiana]